VEAGQTGQTADSAKGQIQSDWVKTSGANIFRHKPSGVFFARAHIP
jgi:hypothetical protein